MVTSCCGRSSIDTIYLYVNPTPAVSNNPIQTSCAGAETSLGIIGMTAQDTAIWSPSTNLTILSKDSVLVSPTVTTTYSATVYSAVKVGAQTILTCPTVLNYTITVDSLPNPMMSSTAVICENDGTASVSLTGGMYDFVWSNGAVATNTNSASITGLSVGNYCVTVTNVITGCIDSACVTVGLSSSAPIGFANTITGVSCFGHTDGCVTIGTTNGTAPFTYVWDTLVPRYLCYSDRLYGL